MECPHCKEEGLSFFDVNTFSSKEKILTCRICNKQSYYPNLKFNEENPIIFIVVSVLFFVSYLLAPPLKITVLIIMLFIIFNMLFTRKVYAFNTQEELELLKKSFLPQEEIIDDRLKDYPEALEYYENNNAFKLAIFYEEILKDYEKAILWYEKAYMQGNENSLNIIGLIYKNKLNDNDKAKEFFIESVKIGNLDSMQNLALFYHTILNDNVRASAYYIALIDIKYSKDEVLKILREDLNIDDETIKKGYELQLTMPRLPRRYKGKLNLKINISEDSSLEKKIKKLLKINLININ